MFTFSNILHPSSCSPPSKSSRRRFRRRQNKKQRKNTLDTVPSSHQGHVMAPDSQQKQMAAPCTPKEGQRPPVLHENWRRRPHAPFQHKNLPPVSQKEPTFIKDMRRPYESHKDERQPPLPLINDRRRTDPNFSPVQIDLSKSFHDETTFSPLKLPLLPHNSPATPMLDSPMFVDAQENLQ